MNDLLATNILSEKIIEINWFNPSQLGTRQLKKMQEAILPQMLMQ